MTRSGAAGESAPLNLSYCRPGLPQRSLARLHSSLQSCLPHHQHLLAVRQLNDSGCQRTLRSHLTYRGSKILKAFRYSLYESHDAILSQPCNLDNTMHQPPAGACDPLQTWFPLTGSPMIVKRMTLPYEPAVLRRVECMDRQHYNFLPRFRLAEHDIALPREFRPGQQGASDCGAAAQLAIWCRDASRCGRRSWSSDRTSACRSNRQARLWPTVRTATSCRWPTASRSGRAGQRGHPGG